MSSRLPMTIAMLRKTMSAESVCTYPGSTQLLFALRMRQLAHEVANA